MYAIATRFSEKARRCAAESTYLEDADGCLRTKEGACPLGVCLMIDGFDYDTVTPNGEEVANFIDGDLDTVCSADHFIDYWDRGLILDLYEALGLGD